MSKHARPEAYSIVQKGVGTRIGWVREILMPNRSELARLMGIDASTLAKIEDGTRAPSIFNVIEIANRLRVSTDFLLRGLLTARTDEELALELAARHPDLVLQRARNDRSKDMDPASDIPQPSMDDGRKLV